MTHGPLNISLGPDSGFNSYRNFSNRPETVNETTKNLMGAMKISNELITELGDRVRRSEGKIEELKYGSGRGLKVNVIFCMRMVKLIVVSRLVARAPCVPEFRIFSFIF